MDGTNGEQKTRDSNQKIAPGNRNTGDFDSPFWKDEKEEPEEKKEPILFEDDAWTAEAKRDHFFKCLFKIEGSCIISMGVFDPKTFASLSSGQISRLFLGSCRLFVLM